MRSTRNKLPGPTGACPALREPAWSRRSRTGSSPCAALKSPRMRALLAALCLWAAVLTACAAPPQNDSSGESAPPIPADRNDQDGPGGPIVPPEGETPDRPPQDHEPADTETIARVVNSILVGSLSYDSTWNAPGPYTITVSDGAGRTDAYSCLPQDYSFRDSLPGWRLAEDFTWSAAGAPGREARNAGDFTFTFANDRCSFTVFSWENTLSCTDEAGERMVLTAVPKYVYASSVSQEFAGKARRALYDHEIGAVCSVDGGETDWDAIASQLGQAYVQCILDRPGWAGQLALDVKLVNTEVFDTYCGTDDPNFCFGLRLYLKLSEEQFNSVHWQAGSGLSDPIADGPWAGWYEYGRDVCAAKGPDGNWHITGFNTGGSSVRLPTDLWHEDADRTAGDLIPLFFLTTGHTHDWMIPYRLAERPLEEVQAGLQALEEADRQTLTEALESFFREEPDRCVWPADALAQQPSP